MASLGDDRLDLTETFSLAKRNEPLQMRGSVFTRFFPEDEVHEVERFLRPEGLECIELMLSIIIKCKTPMLALRWHVTTVTGQPKAFEVTLKLFKPS
jgi:hypothetical protein